MRHGRFARRDILGRGFMKITRNGRPRYSREFKIAAVRRVRNGEGPAKVAGELGIRTHALWRWRTIVEDKGETHLHEWGRPKREGGRVATVPTGGQERIAE